MPNTTYNITLTETQKRSLEYAAKDPLDWIDNVTTNRARIAKNEIVEKLVAHCNANDIQLAVGDSDQVAQAYTLGVVKTAVQRDSDLTASILLGPI